MRHSSLVQEKIPHGGSPTNPNWWKDFPFPGTSPSVRTPSDLNGNGIPDYIEDIKKKVTKASVTRSPIALDLNGDGITTGLEDGAYFDYDGNGFAEQTGWVNSQDGILGRDLDGNSAIDTGRELFGSETLLANGQKAANDYQALAELDTNHDGQINQQDAAFAGLEIWKDANGDGYSSADEFLILADAGVQSIATGYTAVNQIDANGSSTQQFGAFTKTDGSTGTTADIWFQVDKKPTPSLTTGWKKQQQSLPCPIFKASATSMTCTKPCLGTALATCKASSSNSAARPILPHDTLSPHNSSMPDWR